MDIIASDLSIKSENIQSLYGYYIQNAFLVNRRYQRKLVWTIQEKQSFIESIISKYPVPLILLAEKNNKNNKEFEIIDGMQRLNAIMSFINQEFDIDGEYFDLDTLADTKLAKDSHRLLQKCKVMDRAVCAEIARYQIPLSIYQEADERRIDEVFRRLNSGGKQLSRQELRQAGATSKFASIVRELSSRIRGDATSSDIINLNVMQKISINNKRLDYGILAEDVFWIKNNIITKEGLKFFMFAITNILSNDSVALVSGDGNDVIEKAFGEKVDSNLVTLKGVVSRKKQIIPPLTKAIQG